MNRLQLDPERALPAQVADALCDLTRRVGAGIAGGDGDYDRAIHDSRTSLKKLRALLRLLRPALPPETFRDEDHRVRDFGRQLCGVRDAAVMLATFRELKESAAGYLKQTVTAPVEHALERNYLEAQKARDSGPTAATLAPQFQRLERSLLALEPAAFDADMLIDAIRRVYRDGLHGYRSMQSDLDAERSHAWRKDVKYLWYQLQSVATPGRKSIRQLCKKLDKLGDTLGREHDLVVLEEYLAHHGLFRDPAHEAVLRGLIDARRRALVDDALRHAADIYTRKPAAFAHWLRDALATA